MTKKITNDFNQELKNLLNQCYAPYSKIYVSAIVVMKNKQLYSGINIENSTFTPSICAERCAIFKAISEEKKPLEFKELHLMSSTKQPLYPCGVCLQVMSEFFQPETPIFIYSYDKKIVNKKLLKELLPFAVTKEYF